jgi:hypothetical protein
VAGSGASLPSSTAPGGAAGIAVEDLAGQAPTASASSTQGLGVSDAQARALLDQLNTLSQEFKSKQAEQKAALEALEERGRALADSGVARSDPDVALRARQERAEHHLLAQRRTEGEYRTWMTEAGLGTIVRPNPQGDVLVAAKL